MLFLPPKMTEKKFKSEIFIVLLNRISSDVFFAIFQTKNNRCRTKKDSKKKNGY